MSIPEKTTVLVCGGGPGGSYTASALAREGVSVVLLEADIFPRYHIGESMLASMRHFLKFIDLDETFDNYGFIKKRGAAFKLNEKPEGFTDFIAAGGEGNYAWNVVRSEADDLMFKHAAKSGAKCFDGVAVKSIEFVESDVKNGTGDDKITDPGRPVSAQWARKSDGATGTITFDYLVDATGRAGIVSTKYLKNRKFNQGLKNIANWGYWEGAATYAPGTQREGQPFFEALTDASGWCWMIPLHNGVTSIGIVQNQEVATQKKKAMTTSGTEAFYKKSMDYSPRIQEMLKDAKLTSDIKQASDWSYSASSYATPFVRIVGDAGCFIDPYFSSGVHLALSSALSAAVTIRASMKGEIEEPAAGKWHSSKVSEGYTRFLLVVLSALKQIRKQEAAILSDWDEDGFERAFKHFRPIIQGTADTGGKLTQKELTETVDFCLNAFQHSDAEEREAVLAKVEENNAKKAEMANENRIEAKADANPEGLTEDEMKILKSIRARQMLRSEDCINIDSFGTDTIDGYAPLLKTGELGLVKPQYEEPKFKAPTMDLFSKAKEDIDEEKRLKAQQQQVAAN